MSRVCVCVCVCVWPLAILLLLVESGTSNARNIVTFKIYMAAKP